MTTTFTISGDFDAARVEAMRPDLDALIDGEMAYRLATYFSGIFEKLLKQLLVAQVYSVKNTHSHDGSAGLLKCFNAFVYSHGGRYALCIN